MSRVRIITVFLVLACFLLASFNSFAEEKSTKAAKADDGKITVAISKLKAPKSPKAFRKMADFIGEFLTRDDRYAFVKKATPDTSRTMSVVAKKCKKGFKITISSVIGGTEEKATGIVPRRVSTAGLEAELGKVIRSLFDYKPKKRKVLVKILGKAAEGDADASAVEQAMYDAISSEYEMVPPDPYKLPVKDKDIPNLYKGRKKELKVIKEIGGADVLIAGTVKMPKTKNIGSAVNPKYRGVAKVRIKTWDLKRRIVLSDIKMDLKADGIYSELLFSLFDAAEKRAAKELKKDMGFPEPKPEEKAPIDEEF